MNIFCKARNGKSLMRYEAQMSPEVPDHSCSQPATDFANPELLIVHTTTATIKFYFIPLDISPYTL
jgi:hypothetical protein